MKVSNVVEEHLPGFGQVLLSGWTFVIYSIFLFSRADPFSFHQSMKSPRSKKTDPHIMHRMPAR